MIGIKHANEKQKQGCLVSILLAWMLLLCSAHAYAQQTFSRVVIFGDSLSDTGNLALFDLPFPYFQNRISDGLLAVDYLAANLGGNADRSGHLLGQTAGFNYSVSGGEIVGSSQDDLQAQVTAYLGRVSGQAESSALFVIVMGGNDVRAMRNMSAAAAAAATSQTITKLRTEVNRLVQAGAINFLIANVPDVGVIPETLELENSNPGISARATLYTQNYNSSLATMLQDLRAQTSANLIEFDFFSTVEDIFENAAALGFTQTSVGCFDPDVPSFHPDCLLGTRFDRFIFFDSIHPTGAANEIVGNAMIAAVANMAEPGAAMAPIMSGILLLLLDD